MTTVCQMNTWGNWGTEKLNNLPKVAQLMNCGREIWTMFSDSLAQACNSLCVVLVTNHIPECREYTGPFLEKVQ